MPAFPKVLHQLVELEFSTEEQRVSGRASSKQQARLRRRRPCHSLGREGGASGPTHAPALLASARHSTCRLHAT